MICLVNKREVKKEKRGKRNEDYGQQLFSFSFSLFPFHFSFNSVSVPVFSELFLLL